jgi:uncharacterized protein YacL (UPF0231 family)
VEYSFSRNDIDRAQAQLNMEAEAFGHWLSIEMSSHSEAQLQKIVVAIEQLHNRQLYEYEHAGREFHLTLNREGASVSANNLLDDSFDLPAYSESDDELAEQFDDQQDDELSDVHSGLVAHCGLEDFQLLIVAWIAFLQDA